MKGPPPPGFVLYFCLLVGLVPVLTAPSDSRLYLAVGGLVSAAIITSLYALWWRARARRRE